MASRSVKNFGRERPSQDGFNHNDHNPNNYDGGRVSQQLLASLANHGRPADVNSSRGYRPLSPGPYYNTYQHPQYSQWGNVAPALDLPGTEHDQQQQQLDQLDQLFGNNNLPDSGTVQSLPPESGIQRRDTDPIVSGIGSEQHFDGQQLDGGDPGLLYSDTGYAESLSGLDETDTLYDQNCDAVWYPSVASSSYISGRHDWLPLPSDGQHAMSNPSHFAATVSSGDWTPGAAFHPLYPTSLSDLAVGTSFHTTPYPSSVAQGSQSSGAKPIPDSEKKNKCGDCGWSFAAPNKLRRHRESMHRSADTCDYICKCGYYTTRKDNYQRHLNDRQRKSRCYKGKNLFVCKCGHNTQDAGEQLEHLGACKATHGASGPRSSIG